jgi:hypothetical protein
MSAPLRDRLVEALAEWDHRAWAGWTAYMLDRLTPENIARWRRQIETPYAELSEAEKESDRKEARKIVAVIDAHRGLAKARGRKAP